MGIALWIAAGALAAVIARIIRPGRPRRVWFECLTAVVASLFCGVLATALDFGGWKELDWRAGAFATAGTLAVLAGARVVSLTLLSGRGTGGAGAAPR